jgi:nucleotide-binding universal stress UspA family protein
MLAANSMGAKWPIGVSAVAPDSDERNGLRMLEMSFERRTLMYKRILVTLDRSYASEAILREVEHLASESAPQVILLTVAEVPEAAAEAPHPLVVGGALVPGGVTKVPPPRVVEDRGQALERARQELSDYLEEKAVVLRHIGAHVETEVRFGDPAEEILAAAKARQVDVIAMATHGRTGLAQVIFGSVAARVQGSGVRPVLVVRPDRLKGSLK